MSCSWFKNSSNCLSCRLGGTGLLTSPLMIGCTHFANISRIIFRKWFTYREGFIFEHSCFMECIGYEIRTIIFFQLRAKQKLRVFLADHISLLILISLIKQTTITFILFPFLFQYLHKLLFLFKCRLFIKYLFIFFLW